MRLHPLGNRRRRSGASPANSSSTGVDLGSSSPIKRGSKLLRTAGMTTQTEKLLTAEEFAEIAARGDIGRCELVEGRLVPLSGAKPRHGRIAGRVFRYIDRYVEKHHLGV